MGVPALSMHHRENLGLAIALTGVTVAYGAQVVLDDLSLTIESGECVAVMGPSGSGKTSLLRCISGVFVPDAGTVRVGGCELSGELESGRATIRRTGMGLVFQEPDLLPELTVGENVAITRLFDGVPRRRALAEADESLAQVGLSGHAGMRPDQLSGGEAQRAAVARALCRPDVGLIIADEPTASLDRDNADRVTEVLLERARGRGVTVLLATHDPLVADQCDRTVMLQMLPRRARSA